jgi:hypothetical protein
MIHDPVSIEQSSGPESDNGFESDHSDAGYPMSKVIKDEAPHENSKILSVKDHLTNAETLDFWRRYFADFKGKEVSTDHFCDTIQQEYNALVLKPNLDPIRDDHLVEDILAEFYEDLSNRVSIDQKTVSLNALEIFTRNNGLLDAVRSLLQDCIGRNKAQQSIRLNDKIVQELSDVKAMLDAKSKKIAKQEADLKSRQKDFERQKQEAAKVLEQAYAKKMEEAEKKFEKEAAKFAKKLQAAERNLTNKIKLV